MAAVVALAAAVAEVAVLPTAAAAEVAVVGDRTTKA
jgi:hypothetical protein